MTRVAKVLTDEGYGPDFPAGYQGRATLTADGDYLLLAEDDRDDLRAELAGLTDALDTLILDALEDGNG